MNFEEEIWKDIEGYEGLYQVSDWGRVRILDRISGTLSTKYGILSQYTRLHDGSQRVKLYDKNGEKKAILVHRLVAQAFIPEFDQNSTMRICHKDGDKKNNYLTNLKIRKKEVSLNSPKLKRKKGESLNNSKLKREKVFQCDDNLNIIKEWSSIHEAAEVLGLDRKNISKCFRGKYKKSYGYRWISPDDYELLKNKEKETYVCYLNGNIYAKGDIKRMQELFIDYVVTREMDGNIECTFKIVKSDS